MYVQPKWLFASQEGKSGLKSMWWSGIIDQAVRILIFIKFPSVLLGKSWQFGRIVCASDITILSIHNVLLKDYIRSLPFRSLIQLTIYSFCFVCCLFSWTLFFMVNFFFRKRLELSVERIHSTVAKLSVTVNSATIFMIPVNIQSYRRGLWIIMAVWQLLKMVFFLLLLEL